MPDEVVTNPTFSQALFSKLNARKDATQLSEGEYKLLVNARVRNGGAEPIRLPLRDYSMPPGKIQGIYGFDRFLLVFVNGRAYVRDYSTGSDVFIPILDFQLSPDVNTIYAVAVPASTVNNNRIPSVDESDDVVASSPVSLLAPINGSPACILCQDGVTQPWVIFADGTARMTQTYAQWTDDGTNREYVPIGRQMYYSAQGKLYIIAADSSGRYTLILQSVSGRPLDFMIIIDKDGNKLTYDDGNASKIAYAVDFAEITCISGVGANDGGFFVSTVKNSYLVIPNLTDTIFGEPKFNNQALFGTGSLNNNSVVDLLGDQALIDFTGIKSFNAILQTKIRGENAPFSADVHPIFENIVQSITAAIGYNNYGLFGVTTIFGPAILVYDTILPQPAFIALDIFPGVSNIKQFATIETLNTRTMFFITSDNMLFEYEQGNRATAELYVGEWTAGEYGSEIKTRDLNIVLSNVLESGTVYATCYVDNKEFNTLSEVVTQVPIVQPLVVNRPFANANLDTDRCPTFDFSSVMSGWKVGFYIKWNFASRLLKVDFAASILDSTQSVKEQARSYASLSKTLLKS